ncbi:MAG: pantetheine-phosphate adenylyltransferase [Clostridia bacterium]|nr:pantetheine-phosphate adenylyltransferase [Clostridia bacterium]
MKEKEKSIAIVPGSFDPITNGHIDILRRASEEYDKVYLAVMINSNKNYMFNISQRTNIAKAAVADIPNVEVICSEGMLWELARDLSAVAIVKGYRNDIDLEYERSMAEYNSAHYPEAQTVLLQANERLTDVSSTAVRGKILNGEPLDGILPSGAINEINKIIAEQKL